MLCCGYTLTDFPISIRLTSLALWQSNDCPSASKATLMNMDKYFMWIHYERLHNHNKAKHNKTVCIFLGLYCSNPHTRSIESMMVTCRLFGAVSEWILTHCYLNQMEQILVKFKLKYHNLLIMKCENIVRNRAVVLSQFCHFQCAMSKRLLSNYFPTSLYWTHGLLFSKC